MNDLRFFQLTDAGIRPENNYFYLTGELDLFPENALGGSNEDDKGQDLTFYIVGRRNPLRSDVDKTKPFIRKRKWLQNFFKQHKLKGGDCIIVERINPTEYSIYPQRNRGQ